MTGRTSRQLLIGIAVISAVSWSLTSFTGPRQLGTSPADGSESRPGTGVRRSSLPVVPAPAPEAPLGDDPTRRTPNPESTDRFEVYRRLASTHDPDELREWIDLLRVALSSEYAATLDADLRAAAEEDDPLVITVCAALLVEEIGRGEVASPAPTSCADWLGYFSLSPAASAAVTDVILALDGECPECFESLLAQWRDGGWDEGQYRCAERLFRWLARDPDVLPLFVALLEDRDPRLRALACAVLLAEDAVRYAPMVEELASQTSDARRVALLTELLRTYPESQQVEILLSWQERWPSPAWSNAWVGIGFENGDALIRAYRSTADAVMQQQILTGWSSASLDPAGAERFLTEVYDTASAVRVRGQALLALGQLDDPRARHRLEEAAASTTEEDVILWAHLMGGVRNAVSRAPETWVQEFVVPLARRAIRSSGERTRASELEFWRSALSPRFPQLAGELQVWSRSLSSAP